MIAILIYLVVSGLAYSYYTINKDRIREILINDDPSVEHDGSLEILNFAPFMVFCALCWPVDVICVIAVLINDLFKKLS